MIKTRVTDMFNLSYPIMSSPMSEHSGGTLAAAVSSAGGLGLFGGSTGRGPDWIREQCAYVRSKTNAPFGVGFITNWLPMHQEHFEAVLDEHVAVITFSFDDPLPYMQRAKDSGAAVICQVQTIRLAEQAIDAGADVLVAQGNEAGGHTGSLNLLPFLSRLLDRFPDVPIMASGGIASGRSLAAVLAAGADGAWIGTAFLATPEAIEVPDSHKELIVNSDADDTIFSPVYDIIGTTTTGTPHWPKTIAGRTFNNSFVKQWHGRDDALVENVAEAMEAIAEAEARDDRDVRASYMGESAAFVNSIRPAADVLRDVCESAESHLRNGASRLS